MTDYPEINIEKVSQILADNFGNLTSITDIIKVLLENKDLNDMDRMMSMFSMGRRFENNRIKNEILGIFTFTGTDHESDEEEDIEFEEEPDSEPEKV